MATTDERRLAGLDTLRGLAILLVLLYHCTPNSNSDLGLSSIIFKIAKLGWAGVDIFFVLSGFLICRMLLSLKDKKISLRVFFWNRLIRIVPIYILSLVVVLILLPIFLREEIPSFSSSYQYWFYLSNYFTEGRANFYDHEVSLGHFWSLAVEIQFYLLFPIVVIKFSRDAISRVLLILWLAVIMIRTYAIYNGVDSIITFSYIHFRCDGLLLGAIIAASGKISEASRLVFKIAALISALYLVWVTWFSQGSMIFKIGEQYYLHRSLLPVTISILSAYLLYFVLQKPEENFWINRFGLGFLAKYSYGIYIYHFLYNNYLEQLLLPLLGQLAISNNSIGLIYFFIQLALSCMLALISYHLIEKKCMRLKIRY